MPLTYNRLVVKLGTSLLTAGSDHLNLQTMATLVEQIASLHQRNAEIVVVSSGAVAAGRHKLGKSQAAPDIAHKQVLASIGQSSLMHAYEQLFGWHHIVVAQALLTRADIMSRAGYLNARNTLLALLEVKAICIVNENDVVAVEELGEAQFGDNDYLSAMVANLVDADLLVILSDIDGLYTTDPHLSPEAKLIPMVERIESSVESLAGGAISSQGTGGMATKIEAAKLATSSGVSMVIANGREKNALIRLAQGESLGTLFPTSITKLESRKRWMLSGVCCRGQLTLDEGAVKAITENGRSLLPAGIKEVLGDFQRGEVLEILNSDGRVLGTGIANYGSTDLAKIKGKHSDVILRVLGYEYGEEAIHRNNMVIYEAKD